ncbi:unnamed protein product, partial [Mesorhabditis belari]|uniref:Ribosomal protein S14 n=1 Tax=Mesorhabditis belari TaxID=2138241 RepID=A0AAF3E9N8_9BILA
MLRRFLSIGNNLLPKRFTTTSIAQSSKDPIAASNVEATETIEETLPKSEADLQEKQQMKKEPLVKEAYSLTTFQKLKLDQYPYYVEREWWKTGKRTCFWATWRQLRDWKRRLLIQETGADRMRFKAIKANTILPQAIRDEAAETLHKMPMYSHPKLVLSMCMFTGRQRGKIKPYRISRHLFRRYADHSQLSGVQRAMW